MSDMNTPPPGYGFDQAPPPPPPPPPPAGTPAAPGAPPTAFSPPPSMPTTPAPTTSTWTWDAASILLVVGAGAGFLGSLLPWATVGAFSLAGTEGDGIITLFLALAGGVLGILGISRSRKGFLVGSLLCALLWFAVSFYDMLNINSVADGPFGLTVQVGSGLYLTVAGGAAALVGSGLALRR